MKICRVKIFNGKLESYGHQIESYMANQVASGYTIDHISHGEQLAIVSIKYPNPTVKPSGISILASSVVELASTLIGMLLTKGDTKAADVIANILANITKPTDSN